MRCPKQTVPAPTPSIIIVIKAEADSIDTFGLQCFCSSLYSEEEEQCYCLSLCEGERCCRCH